MNPADKTVQELTQSLSQSEQTIQQLTEILSKSEKRSQWLERTFRWLAILFICLTMTVFYVGFDWINHAQATANVQPMTAPAATPKTTPKPGTPKPEDEFKYQRQSCQQGMQLMMVKQAQDLLVTSLTLNKDIQQLPANNPMTPMMTSMNDYLNEKLGSSFPKDKKEMKEAFDKMFADNSRIACDTFVQVMNITRKLEQFKADWNIVRELLLQKLVSIRNGQDKNRTNRKNQQDPLYPVAKEILEYLTKNKDNPAITIDETNKITVKRANMVDGALVSYLASGVMKGIASLNILGEIQRALKAVPDMNTNMEYMNTNMMDMNAHMYYMMRNMGVMTGDMDSTLGRAGRNMPWMPW